MGSDRVQIEGKSSSTLTPGFKPKQFSFLQPRYQDQVETDSVQGNKQPANPTPALSHSFGRMSVRPIQAKLTIGQPNDKYEQEADRVASQVVQQISTPSSAQSTQGQSVQRMEEPEEEELQAKPMISVLQRMEEPEEEELQTKPQISAIQRSHFLHQLSQNPVSEMSRSNKTGLPDQLKKGIENLSGYSMEEVRVHYNSEKPSPLHAHAYAQGTNIHIATGQEKYLPHEAWHVVQQMQGRVKPTMQAQGMDINDDRALEREADEMGEKAEREGLQGEEIRQREQKREKKGGGENQRDDWERSSYSVGGKGKNMIQKRKNGATDEEIDAEQEKKDLRKLKEEDYKQLAQKEVKKEGDTAYKLGRKNGKKKNQGHNPKNTDQAMAQWKVRRQNDGAGDYDRSVGNTSNASKNEKSNHAKATKTAEQQLIDRLTDDKFKKAKSEQEEKNKKISDNILQM